MLEGKGRGSDLLSVNIAELKDALAEAGSDASLTILLPQGDSVPSHFHITEVGHVLKDFIDCGGTRRQISTCSLQTYVAHDVEHRLAPSKLLKILSASAGLLPGDDLPVELEHQGESITLYSLDAVERVGDQIVFRLGAKQTACLAPDQCGIGPAPGEQADAAPNFLMPDPSGCCSTGST